MDIQDLFVTPIVLTLVYFLAYTVRRSVTDRVTKKYFIPALTLKIVGAIALGAVYQFYYGGGDTFTFYELGSKYIYQAFWESPSVAFKLIFLDDVLRPDTMHYASRIFSFGDSESYFVVRCAGFIDLFTFHTYSATAVIFAVLSFSGLWAMYRAFYHLYPNLDRGFAIAIFFIPSVFFWGSGILKDTITMGALGWATYGIYQVFFRRKKLGINIPLLTISLLVVYMIKIYILMCFVPAAITWVFLSRLAAVKSVLIKLMIAPIILASLVVLSFLMVKEIGENDPQYELQNITQTAEITARYLSYISARDSGSGYTLGDFDYSPAGIARKAPKAVWVTLFRPYLWESNNIVMLLSALESMAFFFFTLLVIIRSGITKTFRKLLSEPTVIFCLIFAITFSFAIGISTYNFGSLVRYKIPMMPFYISAMYIIYQRVKRRKKPARQAAFEKRSSTVSLPRRPMPPRKV